MLHGYGLVTAVATDFMGSLFPASSPDASYDKIYIKKVTATIFLSMVLMLQHLIALHFKDCWSKHRDFLCFFQVHRLP